MLITILTTGSRGDTQPYIALGMELKKSGHEVRVAAFENYAGLIMDHGLEFSAIKGDVSLVASGDSTKSARQADNPLKILMSFSKLKSYVFDMQKDFFNACKGSDVVLYHPGAPIGYFIARYMNIPSILATPFPMTPTNEYPALIFYNSFHPGKAFNRLTYKAFEQIIWFPSSSAVKRFWKEEFGKIPEDFSCPFEKQVTSIAPTINACSNYVFAKPKDWPEDVHNSGYWFLDEEMGWKPPRELLDFLKKGKPPVYIGFGSVGDATLADQTTELVIDSLKRAGQRGLLATGWNGLSKMEKMPEDIFILESAPHSWLFPRMAAVVHHGGAGTTAAGLRAGVPSIIIPFSNDQFAWAKRVFELGVGPKPIPRKKLTAEKLSDAINDAFKNEIIEGARVLGSKIKSEKGTETAAKIVMDCVEQFRREKGI
jgi:sterol 3beta-glucosyltransferase